MKAFEKHQKVLEDNKKIIMEAEKIKKSPAFQEAMHYFAIQKSRGNIEEYPCLGNGYNVRKTERRMRNEQRHI